MDYTVSTLNSLGDMSSTTAPMYPPFAAPTPVHLRTLTSVTNCVASPLHGLDFPSITSPSSSYSFYGAYSPAQTPRLNPQYDPNYLHRLKSNPMFRDLQSVLRQECLQMTVPANLITTSWNLMQLPKTTATPTSLGSGQEVYHQHMQLQDKLLQVRIDPTISADGLSVENEYSTHVGHTEMGRYRALHSCPDDTVKATINSYYDKERIELVKATEEKLDKLIKKSEEIRRAIQKVNKEKTVLYPVEGKQPLLQGASLLLQPATDDSAKFNAVRKLKFNESDENVNVDDDDDYLNCSVNSEDFEIDEIDVETVDTKSDNGDIRRDVNEGESEKPASSQSEQNLLKLCIVQSGIAAEGDSLMTENNTNITNPTEESSNVGQVFPDSTADSPVSVDSSDSGCDLHNSTTMPSNRSFDRNYGLMSQNFSTPITSYGQPMIQPQDINRTLAQMEKLCGGPRVNFTPELRRDFTMNYTPKIHKLSPLTDICPNSGNGAMMNDSGLHNVSSTSVTDNHNHINTSANTRVQESDNNIDSTAFRSHRTLTADSTSVLSSWYQAHVNYPYPDEAEVSALATQTGITARQVKKWMANKRVRCYNTLSITGNQHPIKHKYKAGQKRKSTMDKENSVDPATNKKPNYTLMNDSSRQILNQWYEQNIVNPYPSEDEKQRLADQCEISVNQVKSWFANKRNRTNNTRRQVPNYFIKKHPEYSYMVEFVGQKREEARNIKRRKLDQYMYIQPPFYI